jgi:hypothetical protein
VVSKTTGERPLRDLHPERPNAAFAPSFSLHLSGEDDAMPSKTTGGQQKQPPQTEAHGGDNTGGGSKTQGKRGNGAQRLKQKK